MTTTTGSVCRSCNAPLEWRDTPEGRRPFDPGTGTRHVDARPGAPRRNGADLASPNRDREIRRQVAAKVAGGLLAAALQSRDDARIDHFPRVADLVLAWLERP
jgi:hypothetical protein